MNSDKIEAVEKAMFEYDRTSMKASVDWDDLPATLARNGVMGRQHYREMSAAAIAAIEPFSVDRMLDGAGCIFLTVDYFIDGVYGVDIVPREGDDDRTFKGRGKGLAEAIADACRKRDSKKPHEYGQLWYNSRNEIHESPRDACNIRGHGKRKD